MSDVEDYFENSRLTAKQSNVAAIDSDPDQAAESLDLSDSTGVPSSAIYGDLDGFKRAHKVALGSAIISDNEYIADYLNSHPMAPRVSHDDLGALDDVSRSIGSFYKDTRLGQWLNSDSVAKSFEAGWGEQPFGQTMFQRPTDVEWALSHPLIASIASLPSIPLEGLARTTGGLLHMGYDGMSAVFGEKFAREMAGMAEYGMMRGDIGVRAAGGGASGPLARLEQNAKLFKDMHSGLEISDLYTAAGKEAAIGIHPLIDKAKELQIKEDMDSHDEILNAANKTATRERSSEFFSKFIEQHPLPQREIGIDSDAVRRLYGDKPPTADDNLLGWIPDLDKQLARVALTGEDIRVPAADWYAKVDPEVAKQLHDDIRPRDNGFTLNETKIGTDVAEAKPAPPETLDWAAVKHEGKTYLGQTHTDAIEQAVKDTGKSFNDIASQLKQEDMDGFYTSKGRYVSRDEAEKIASSAGQVKRPDKLHDERLLAENTRLSHGKTDQDFVLEELGGGKPRVAQPPAEAIPDVGAKHPEPQPKEVIPEPVQATRGSAGLEPMFSVGDRKLTLDKRPPRIEGKTGVIAADEFRIHDETGQKVGWLEATPSEGGKRVYVDNVGGFESFGFGPNSFGPGLTRSLIKQLKEHYPQLEEIGGFRISGAREKAGTEREVWIKVEAGEYLDEATHEHFRNLLTNNWEQVTKATSALFDVEGKGLAANSLMGQLILSEVRRIAPQAEPDVAHAIELRGAPVRGVYIPNLRQIIVSLQSGVVKDPIGTVRHESIHALRDMGLFSDKEWDTLEKAAETEGWIKKFDVEAKWANIKGARFSEEAIAEAYRDWAGGARVAPEVHTIFEKIKAFLDGLRQRFGEMLGHDLTWEQIFEKVDSGEIGRREADEEITGPEPSAQPSDEGPGLYDRGKALGVTQAHMDRMLRLIDKRNKEDFEAAGRRAEVRQRRKSNKEWKERRTQLRDEVRENLSSRPDLALDELFSKQKIKIDPSTLSEDQRSALPKDYIQKKDGINPDDLAPYFGYTSGDALVERLAMLTEDRRRSGMSQRDYFNRLVDVETDRRLNREFGDRQQTILDEAKDQALSETQLNLTHEETLAYALKAGQEPQFTKEETRAMVKEDFDSRVVGSISSDILMQKAGMIGKRIEEAGAKGKWDEAYRLSQQRNHTVIAAKLAKDYEKARRQFDRTAKTFSKNRTFTGVDQEYVNWIQDLLLRTGHSLSRSVQDLAENIGRQLETNLSDFIDAKEAFFMGIRPLDVPDFLRDPDFRTAVDDLSVHDFEGLRQGIKILEKAGRDEKSVNVSGEAWDLAKTKSEFRKQLEGFGYSLAKALPENSKFRVLRAMAYGLTNMETLLNRWDRGNPMGVFNRVIVYPLVEAANGKSRLLREIAKDLQTIERPSTKELQKLVDAPFPEPMTPDGQGTWTGFNRGNVLMMLQNAGNSSNWNVLARGYGAEPEALFKWLQKNVTKEDVQRAQGIGNIFKKLIAKSDNVYERTTGATVEKIPLKPITFNFADGTTMDVPGWYHPLDRDPVRASMWKEDPQTGAPTVRTGSRSRESAFGDADYFHASTSNGYTKKRTGVIYQLNLDFNMAPSRMRQMAHDIHFREPLLNIEKIFADRLFQEDVAKYYGREYAKGLMPYLRHLAGSEGIRSENAMWGDAFLEKARQNIISTYIGFNPFTIFKHGPTAWVFSSAEVGTGAFVKAALELAKPGTSDIHTFIKDNSEEIQRRERHWQDTIAGQGNELSAKSTTREQIIDWGSKGVAWSDMVSAKPTWWAAYQKYRAEQLPHGQAVTLADRAVRRAHGSTAETNLPPWVRAGGPLNRFMTSVYGFFGTAMQRRIELAHQANDIYKLGREGELREASKNVVPLLRNFMTYVIWPTVVEEMVTGMTTEDKRGWGAHILSGTTMGISSSILYARDLMYGLTTGHDPGAGLVSSAMHDVANVARDIRKGREALNKQHAGKTIEDALTLFGEATGKMPKTIARGAHFGVDYMTGQQKPKTPVEWMRGLSHGQAVRRKR